MWYNVKGFPKERGSVEVLWQPGTVPVPWKGEGCAVRGEEQGLSSETAFVREEPPVQSPPCVP